MSQSYVHSRTTITLRLDKSEEWMEFDDKERPFFVQQIYLTVDGDERIRDQKATLRGVVIKVDGSRGYVNRTVGKSVLDLPYAISESILTQVKASRFLHGSVEE